MRATSRSPSPGYRPRIPRSELRSAVGLKGRGPGFSTLAEPLGPRPIRTLSLSKGCRRVHVAHPSGSSTLAGPLGSWPVRTLSLSKGCRGGHVTHPSGFSTLADPLSSRPIRTLSLSKGCRRVHVAHPSGFSPLADPLGPWPIRTLSLSKGPCRASLRFQPARRPAQLLTYSHPELVEGCARTASGQVF